MTDKFPVKMREGVLHDIATTLEKTFREGIHKSCLSCRHFTEATENCGLFNGRPPARVLVLSCAKHEDNDDIPF